MPKRDWDDWSDADLTALRGLWEDLLAERRPVDARLAYKAWRELSVERVPGPG